MGFSSLLEKYRRARRPLLRVDAVLRRLLWQEWRETRLILLAALVLIALPLLPPLVGVRAWVISRWLPIPYAVGLVILTALIGARSGAEERAAGSGAFRAALPAGSLLGGLPRLLVAALEVAGLALAAYAGYRLALRLEGSYIELYGQPLRVRPESYRIFAQLLGLLFVSAVYFSSVVRNPFRGAFWSLILTALYVSLIWFLFFLPFSLTAVWTVLNPSPYAPRWRWPLYLVHGLFGALLLFWYFRRAVRPGVAGPWRRGLKELSLTAAVLILLAGLPAILAWRVARTEELQALQLVHVSPDGEDLLINVQTSNWQYGRSGYADSRVWRLSQGRVREVTGPISGAVPGAVMPAAPGRPGLFICYGEPWARVLFKRPWVNCLENSDRQIWRYPEYQRGGPMYYGFIHGWPDIVPPVPRVVRACRLTGEEQWRMELPADAVLVRYTWIPERDAFLELALVGSGPGRAQAVRTRIVTPAGAVRPGDERTFPGSGWPYPMSFDGRIVFVRLAVDRQSFALIDRSGRIDVLEEAGVTGLYAVSTDGRFLFLIVEEEETGADQPFPLYHLRRRDRRTGRDVTLFEWTDRPYFWAGPGGRSVVFVENVRVDDVPPPFSDLYCYSIGGDKYWQRWFFWSEGEALRPLDLDLSFYNCTGAVVMYSPSGDKIVLMSALGDTILLQRGPEGWRQTACGRLPGIYSGHFGMHWGGGTPGRWLDEDTVYYPGYPNHIYRFVLSRREAERVFP